MPGSARKAARKPLHRLPQVPAALRSRRASARPAPSRQKGLPARVIAMRSVPMAQCAQVSRAMASRRVMGNCQTGRPARVIAIPGVPMAQRPALQGVQASRAMGNHRVTAVAMHSVRLAASRALRAAWR